MRLTWWVSVGVAALACSGESITHGGRGSSAHDGGATAATGGRAQPPGGEAGGSSGASGTAGLAGRPGAVDVPLDPVAGAGGEGNEAASGQGARDGGLPADAGGPKDAGAPVDAGEPSDAGTFIDDAGNAIPQVECPLNPDPAKLELLNWDEPTPKRTQQEAFDTASRYIVGSWRGIVTTPWTADYEASLWFDATGHWGGSCAVLSESCCVVFYYGTDRDCDLKRYSIDDATLSGKVTGTIDIPFYYGDQGCGLPSWQGELSSVVVDADFDRLRFDFRTSDGYGPVHFELERVAGEAAAAGAPGS